MDDIESRPIRSIDRETLQENLTGYSSSEKLGVQVSRVAGKISFELLVEKLFVPYIKAPTQIDEWTLKHYNDVAATGFSFCAYRGARCLGFILAEPQEWNSSLVVREFGVRKDARGSGVGRALLTKTFEAAQAKSFRCLVCETQTTNVPAIKFYQKLGFEIHGLDIGLYSNRGLDRGEVAIFMRKQIPAP